ncbi:hypothetical protein [Lentzea albida]|uniref:hypothetical protein n=1 Tax=Lentzea albida TaxID=65499 RepID=UPI000B7CFA98|nr:hypothetical protein [Lentzea albida]
MIVVAVLAAVVLVGGGITAAILVKGGGEQAVPEPEAADSGVIAQEVDAEPVEYGDVVVIDACTVMPASLLEEVGFRDAAHGWHSQVYLPRSVPVADATVKPQSDAISMCLYESTAEGGIERFTLSVRQPPFNHMGTAGYVGKDDTPVTVAGLKGSVSPGLSPDSFDASLVSADGKAQVNLGASRMGNVKEITDPKATFMVLLERVAANFAKGPQGRTTHVHTGRYASVPNACEILSSERFQEITSSKDSGVVEADYYEQETADRFEDTSLYSNLQECRRLSPEWWDAGNRGQRKALKISLRTYRDAGMAIKDAQDCNPDSPSRKVTGEAAMSAEKIGDGAACSYLQGDSPTISFLAGRTQVRLTGYGDWAPDDPKAYVQAFTPIAQKLADEVRKAIG